MKKKILTIETILALMFLTSSIIFFIKVVF